MQLRSRVVNGGMRLCVQINSLGLFAATVGHEPPAGPFYELQAPDFFAARCVRARVCECGRG